MNLAKLRKDEIVWMSQHYCRHRHTYIQHPGCYEIETQPPEKLGFIDIETGNLDADFGIIISWAIKERGGKTYGRLITPEELRSPDMDKQVVSSCISKMREFDRLIGFYSGRFDIPFIRTRAMSHNLSFPEFGEIRHTDLWLWVRSKMRLHRNRLGVACTFLGIPAKEHRMNPVQWTRALAGDKKSLKYIYIHNLEDVESTELLFERLLPFHRLTRTCL